MSSHTPESIHPSLQMLLERMLQKGASDLHLKVGCPPALRVDGVLQHLPDLPPLKDEHTRKIAEMLVPTDRRDDFAAHHDLEFSFGLNQVSRYRASVLHQRGTVSLAVRRIPVEVPTLERLGAPKILERLAQLPHGLVLVTGATGSGKSTTLAAILDHLNETGRGHILTMEDPIEFVHVDKRSFLTQREIGVDAPDFRQALQRALRHDPDVIMIGEMRDLETISLAVDAAETGHLVFATLHTMGAVATVDRVIDAFPPDARSLIRVQLAQTLQGVISQTLVRKLSGGRVAAYEVLVCNEAIRSCIREGKTHQIQNLVQTGGGQGMTRMNHALAELVRAGTVGLEEALRHSLYGDELVKLVEGGTGPLRKSRPAPTPRSSNAGEIPLPVEPLAEPLVESGANSNTSLLEKLRRS